MQIKIAGGNLIYQEIASGKELGNFVACYWRIKSYCKSANHSLCYVPARHMNIVFDFTAKKVWIDGLALTPKIINYKHRLELLGVKLHPGAFFSLFHRPAHFFTGRTLPFKLAFNERTPQLEKVFAAATMRARMNTIESIFKKLAENTKPMDRKIKLALENMSDRENTAKIHELIQSVGLSWKRFTVKFPEWTGTTPKIFYGIMQFENALKSLNKYPEKSLSAIAVECGYFDHAHFDNEFKKLCGITPLEYRRKIMPLPYSANKITRIADGILFLCRRKILAR